MTNFEGAESVLVVAPQTLSQSVPVRGMAKVRVKVRGGPMGLGGVSLRCGERMR